MAIQATCPACKAVIRAAEKYAGQQVKCPKCGSAMRVPAAESPSTPGVTSAATVTPSDTPVSTAADTKSVAAASGAAATAASPAETPGGMGDVPIVKVDDDAEAWRKVVSKKRPARQQGSTPAWLLPAVGGGIALAVVALGGLWWSQQSDDFAADSDRPDTIAVAQNTPETSEQTTPTSEPVASNNAPSIRATPEDAQPQPASDSNQTNALAAITSPDRSAAAEIKAASTETLEPAKTPEPDPTTETVATDTSDPADKPEMKSDDATGEAGVAASAVAGNESLPPLDPNLPPEKVIEARGIRLLGDQAALVDESSAELKIGIREAQRLRLGLTRAYAEAQKLERAEKELTQQYGARNAALAQVNATRPNDVSTNNLLVGQLEVISTKREQVEKALEAARAKVAEAREVYIAHLLKTRKIADEVEAKYKQLAADPQVTAAIAELASEGDEIALGPSGNFERSLRDLQNLENQVLSDTIVARVQSGNLHVSTHINDQHMVEMVVDSGASVVTLPYSIAVSVGLKPKETDPVAQFRIADGSLISGRMITIPSLRVGKFTVENVEAAVLGPEAINATPLLGMSFLSKFDVKIDSQRGHLILSRIEGTQGSDRIR